MPGHSDRPPHCLPSQIPLYNRFEALSCMDDDEGSYDFVKEAVSLGGRSRNYRWGVQGFCTRSARQKFSGRAHFGSIA